jgi:hypothetical protein
VIEPFSEDDIEDLVFEYSSDVLSMAKQSAADMRAGRYITMQTFAQQHGLAGGERNAPPTAEKTQGISTPAVAG